MKDISESSKSGPALNIISGFSVGLEATILPVLVIVIAVLSGYYFGAQVSSEIGVQTHVGGVLTPTHKKYMEILAKRRSYCYIYRGLTAAKKVVKECTF